MNWLQSETSFHRQVKLRSLYCTCSFAPLHNVDKRPDPMMIKPLVIYAHLQYLQSKGGSSTQNKKSETFLTAGFEFFYLSGVFLHLSPAFLCCIFNISVGKETCARGLIDIQEGTIKQFIWIVEYKPIIIRQLPFHLKFIGQQV